MKKGVPGRGAWGAMAWIGRHELGTLLLAGLIAVGIWGFVELADEVREGSTERFDRQVLLAMRQPDAPDDPLGPFWVEEIARDVTALGGTGLITLITAATVGYLLLLRKKRAALLVVAAVGGGVLLSLLLKEVFGRPRPDLVPHGMRVLTASFPSGHSMLAAVTYLTLGALLARMHSSLRLKAYFLLLAILTSVLVGVTRIYLGVHWPTDVLAGWAAGAVWALVCWLAARWLQRRGELEAETGNGGNGEVRD